MEKLAKILRISLVLQILIFVWAMWINYVTTHDGRSSMSDLSVIVPMFIFAGVGILNIYVFVAYFASVMDTRPRHFDVATIALTVIVVLIAIFLYALLGLVEGPN